MSFITTTLKSPWLLRARDLVVHLLKYWPWFVFSMVIGHMTKENFPFSHWPMYADFAKNVDYVFFEDKQGQPVPAYIFRETSARLKRQFNSERKREFKELREKNPDREMRPALEKQSVENAALLMTERLGQRLTEKQQAQYEEMRMIRVVLSYDEDNRIKRDRFDGQYISLADLPHAPEGTEVPPLPPQPLPDNAEGSEEEGAE